MKYIVDRIEGNLAVCEAENTDMAVISLADLPVGTHEGSVIVFKNGTYTLDVGEEQERRKRILALQDGIFDE